MRVRFLPGVQNTGIAYVVMHRPFKPEEVIS
jgi:hypothetical protein